MNLKYLSLAIIASVSMPVALAAGLNDPQAVQAKTNNASAKSQKAINSSSDSSFALKSEIEQLEEEVSNLEVYRQHLEKLVENQNQEASNLNTQIQEIKVTRQGVVPLMYQMLDGLKSSIETDAPIRIEQRLVRLEKLETMMGRADVSDAEKYRRILEAYQIELDYGTKLGTYQGAITLANQQEIEADIVYIGRLSLIARNLSGNQYWAWNQNIRQWSAVDNSLKVELDKAFSIASKQAAPSLIRVPVSLTTAEEI